MSVPNRIHSLHRMPTVEAIRANARRRSIQVWLGALALAVVCTILFVGVTFDNIIVPLATIVCVLVPILFWRYPRLAAYVVFASTCLFELFPTDFKDALTDRVPIFWNINTMIQRYGHSQFHGVPINVLELVLIVAGSIALLRGVFLRTASIRLGASFWPILLYMAFVAFGEVRGVTSGGDFKISLQEVRSQFYFLIAYLIAVNNIREPRQVTALQWTMVVCIALKGILYTFRRYVTLAGLPVPDQGVGSHEEAFFFDCFVVMLLILIICGVQPKMRLAMFALLIPVLLGDLATNRRSATAAVLIIVPVLLLAAYQGIPSRRVLARNVGIFLVIAFSIYYPAFRNSSGAIGEPARAIKSQLEPDKRDLNSDTYRKAEEADLYATIKSSPITGYGYGKQMYHAVPIADISRTYPLWDIMTHNQILWVWMRVGTFGFVAFWCMVCAIVMQACFALRTSADYDVKASALFTICALGMLMIFGLLDLQLSNYRDMLFVGYWVGVSANLPTMARSIARAREADAAPDAELAVAGVGRTA